MTGADTSGAAPAVVFDFDGVLADTERLHLRAFQAAFAPLGWTLDETAYVADYLGYDDRDLVTAYVFATGRSIDTGALDDLLRVKARRFREALGRGDALFPGAAACIARLGAHFPLAIASGSLHREITDILDASALTPAFRAIVGADDVPRSKPAPDAYVEAVARLGVAPASAVAVEDSRWGLESARGAGLRTVGLTTTYPAPVLALADVTIDSLDALTPDLVRRLAGD